MAMGLLSRLFKGQPDQATDPLARPDVKVLGEAERQERERARERQAASAHKQGRKGLELAAQSLGLENLRDVEPSSPMSGSYYPRVEGDLLVDGELVILTLAASATPRSSRPAGRDIRDVRVAVLDGPVKLGSLSYDGYSILDDRNEAQYHLSDKVSAPDVSKDDFLSGIQKAITESRELAALGAPALSTLDVSSEDPTLAPDPLEPSRDL